MRASILVATLRLAAITALVAAPAFAGSTLENRYNDGVQLGGGLNYVQQQYLEDQQRIARIPYRRIEKLELRNPFAHKATAKPRWVWVRGETGYVEKYYID